MQPTSSNGKQVNERKRSRTGQEGNDGQTQRREHLVQQRTEYEAASDSETSEGVGRRLPGDSVDRCTWPGSRDKEGTATGSGSSRSLPPRGRGMARVSTFKKGGNAHHSETKSGLSGIDKMRLAESDATSETGDMRKQIQEDGYGAMRRNDACGGLRGRRSNSTTAELEDCRGALPHGGSPDSTSGRIQSTISSAVEGFRHVQHSPRGASRSDAGFKGPRSGLGAGANDVRRLSLFDTELHSGGTVQTHGLRLRAPFKRKIRIQASDEGRRLTSRDTEETDSTFEKKHAAQIDEARRTDSSTKSERADHSVRNATVLQGRRDQALASMRLLTGIRRAVQSTIQAGSSVQDSEKEARSVTARTLPSPAARLNAQTVHHTPAFRDAKSRNEEALPTMHQGNGARGEMPSLPSTVRQLAVARERTEADVQAANLRRGEVFAQIDRDRLEPSIGDLDATRRNISSDTRASTGAGALPSERTRRRDRSEVVHGSGGSARSLRDGASATTLNNVATAHSLQSLIQRASAYGAGPSSRSQLANSTGHAEVADLLDTAILRTLQNLPGAGALGMMGGKKDNSKRSQHASIRVGNQGRARSRNG